MSKARGALVRACKVTNFSLERKRGVMLKIIAERRQRRRRRQSHFMLSLSAAHPSFIYTNTLQQQQQQGLFCSISSHHRDKILRPFCVKFFKF